MFYDVENKITRAMLETAYQWVESKRNQGWEQKDFAERLSDYLESDGSAGDAS